MALNQTRLVKSGKKLRQILSRLDTDPEPEQVHDLRTRARRFEAVFKALSLADAGIPKSVLKDLGSLRKRAGDVRDMDVLTEFAAAVRSKGEGKCHVRLLEHLGARRQKQAGKLHDEVKQLRKGLRKTLEQAESRMQKVLRKNGSGATDTCVAAATATAVRLSAQLAQPSRQNKTNLHPYRLKVKELRNVLLMTAAKSRPAFVEDLGEVKDAIGEWHDWEELAGMASKLLEHGEKCLLLAELKRTAAKKYEHALSLALKLRKTYLRSSGPKRVAVPRSTVWDATARLAE